MGFLLFDQRGICALTGGGPLVSLVKREAQHDERHEPRLDHPRGQFEPGSEEENDTHNGAPVATVVVDELVVTEGGLAAQSVAESA